MKVFRNQIVASTKEDLHGEVRSRDFLQELVNSYPPRMPLHQRHDLSLDTVGYIENYRLVEDESSAGHFHIVADITITAGELDSDLRGFSISFLEQMHCNTEQPSLLVYLPHPLYNDHEFIEELIDEFPDILVGKFVKKQFDPTIVGLIGTGIALLLAPEWDIQYKQRIRPALLQLRKVLHKLLARGISADLMQRSVGPNGEDIDLVLIPQRGNEDVCLSDLAVEEGIRLAFAFLSSDERSNMVGARRVKLYYGPQSSRYILTHVEYRDGTDARMTMRSSGPAERDSE